MNKTYIAYAISYGEQPCGCSSVRYHKVYDRWGNDYEKFTSREEAEVAAKKKMYEKGADNWKVI